MGTASITLRLDAREKAIIQDYASTFGQSLSEFMRTAALQRIEDETDLQAWCEARTELDADPQVRTADEMARKYL
ncbi:type II toxin-antitoxin system RelB family antitoxin [Actinomyces israelii]|jgi:transcriptional regulator|uniref:DUF6290 family protein n=1 Tax=Actinomyces israelii TaxID=1659 RepID=A0ABT4I6R4_9ACTO|nr:DUF6290 family protein [Actinomyces israelii]MCZ0857428.1 DUF6290 family protein [Actinomyces israelii]WKR21532.1 hypothetical protein AIF0345_1447 [Actinomyces israelii]